MKNQGESLKECVTRKWIGFCEFMHWHFPNKNIGFDGCSFESRCKHCNRRILQDSQGNWFTID